jgi:predicted SnoaL-like aldol condensation-catalyzing enzyme
MADEQREAGRKTKIGGLFAALNGRGAVDEALFATGYIAHCAPFPAMPKLAPGAAAVKQRLAARGTIPHRLYRMIADGDFVWTHSRYDGAIPVSGIDIFRFDADDRIAEHWNVRQVIAHDAAKGWDRFAGDADTETVLDDAQREKMRDFIRVSQTAVWGNARADLVFHYYSEDYIQHNPDMPGGSHRIHQIVSTEMKARMERTGKPYPIDFRMIGTNGDLIFLHYSVPIAGIGRNADETSYNADIFRVGKDGRFIEHWDVLQMASEPLPDDSTLF